MCEKKRRGSCQKVTKEKNCLKIQENKTGGKTTIDRRGALLSKKLRSEKTQRPEVDKCV